MKLTSNVLGLGLFLGLVAANLINIYNALSPLPLAERQVSALIGIGVFSASLGCLFGLIILFPIRQQAGKEFNFVLTGPTVKAMENIKRMQENWDDKEVVGRALAVYEFCLKKETEGKLFVRYEDGTEQPLSVT